MDIIFTGCGINQTVNNNDSNNNLVWWIDPNGDFHTNDLHRAQGQIPFIIIIPSYLPANFSYDNMRILGPYESEIVEDIEIEITFKRDDDRVYIREHNHLIFMKPNNELDPIYHDIAGVIVLRQIAQIVDSSGITEGLVFDWNQNNVAFSVELFNVSEDEGIKIVESMITQMK